VSRVHVNRHLHYILHYTGTKLKRSRNCREKNDRFVDRLSVFVGEVSEAAIELEKLQVS